MWNMLKDLIKRLLCGEELDALYRYRQACALAWRWNGQEPNSAETALWINQVGEGTRGLDIGEFREQMRQGSAKAAFADAEVKY